MELGFSGEAFSNLLVLSCFIGVVAIFAISYIAKKRGIDANSSRFVLKLGLGFSIIFVVIPLCLSDLSVGDKILASTLALAAGVANFLAIERMKKVFKNKQRNKE